MNEVANAKELYGTLSIGVIGAGMMATAIMVGYEMQHFAHILNLLQHHDPN